MKQEFNQQNPKRDQDLGSHLQQHKSPGPRVSGSCASELPGEVQRHSHISQHKFQYENLYSNKFSSTHTNTHDDLDAGPCETRWIRTKCNLLPLHTWASVFHLCAHLSPGEEASNTSDQASPTQGRLGDNQNTDHIFPPPLPQKNCSQCPDGNKSILRNLSNNKAPVSLDHGTRRIYLKNTTPNSQAGNLEQRKFTLWPKCRAGSGEK